MSEDKEKKLKFIDAIARYMEKDMEGLIYHEPKCDFEHIWNGAVASCIGVLETYQEDIEVGLNEEKLDEFVIVDKPKPEVFECNECGDPTENKDKVCDACAYVSAMKDNYPLTTAYFSKKAINWRDQIVDSQGKKDLTSSAELSQGDTKDTEGRQFADESSEHLDTHPDSQVRGDKKGEVSGKSESPPHEGSPTPDILPTDWASVPEGDEPINVLDEEEDEELEEIEEEELDNIDKLINKKFEGDEEDEEDED